MKIIKKQANLITTRLEEEQEEETEEIATTNLIEIYFIPPSYPRTYCK
jgi:hypothetical protein